MKNIFDNPRVNDLKNIKDWAFIMSVSFITSKSFEKLKNSKRSTVIYFLEEFRYFADKAGNNQKNFCNIRGKKIPKSLNETILGFVEKKELIKLMDLLDKCFLESEKKSSVFDVLEVTERTRRYKKDLLKYYN